MFLAQAVVVTEVVALILEGVEGLVFNPPAGSTTTHDLHDVVRGDLKIGDPTEAIEDDHLLTVGLDLPVLKEVDPQRILTGLVEGDRIDETKAVPSVHLLTVRQHQVRDLSPLGRLVDLAEHKSVITGLGREDITKIMAHQILDVRGVGAQAILGDNDLQMRMLTAEIGHKASGGVALAIVFGGAVLPPDGFRAQRQHLLAVRRNKGPGHHLQVVFECAIALLFDQAIIGADILRAVEAGSVDRQQQMIGETGHFFKDLAPLHLMKDTPERPPKKGWHYFVQSGSHLGVAGDHPNPVHTVQTFRLLMPPFVKGEQGGILERKHGKAAHQHIRQRDRCVGGPMIRYPLHILADDGKQSVGIEMSTHFDFAICLGFTTVAVDDTLEGRHGFPPCNYLILQ
jgi:hypothetical protein